MCSAATTNSIIFEISTATVAASPFADMLMLTYVLDLIIHVILEWRPRLLLHSTKYKQLFSSFKLLKTRKWHVQHTFTPTPERSFSTYFASFTRMWNVPKKNVNNQLVINCKKFTSTRYMLLHTVLFKRTSIHYLMCSYSHNTFTILEIVS